MQLRSDSIKKGLARAPHRSLLKADGLTDEELDRPLVAVISAQNEVIPGHIHLQQIADAVKAGIRMAGGTPLQMNTIGVCDGIAMNHEGMHYSLTSREVIADSVECAVQGHQFDAMVLIPACDKIVPGMLLAACRLNIPTMLVSGGPMLAGRDKQGCQTDLNTLFEGYDQPMNGLDPERAALYRLCEERDVGITVMKGFFGGRLFDAAQSPFGVAFTPVQLIHYALTRPAAASVLCGYDTPEQVDQAVAYENASDEEKDYATLLASAPVHACRGQCTYCGHCKPCPVNIDIAMVNKFYDLARQQQEVPASVLEHYKALGQTASACLHCRGCEARCPFEVKIADRMRQAAALFGC